MNDLIFDKNSIDFINFCKNSSKDLFLLIGDLGSGKTTFVKKYLKNIEVTSPTYNIVHIYENTGRIFAHFDFYRITKNELHSIDFYEYLRIAHKIFIEWPFSMNYPGRKVCKLYFEEKYVRIRED